MYRAAIFDVDGTLVNSNGTHAQAWVEALCERGRRVEFARVRPLAGLASASSRCAQAAGNRDLRGALAVYDDPADLLNHYDLSPFKRPAPARSA